MQEDISLRIRTYQSIEELAGQFRKSDYCPDLIHRGLVEHKNNTLDALKFEMNHRRILFNKDPGRTAWGTVVDYYRQSNLEEERSRLEFDLYYSYGPLSRHFVVPFIEVIGITTMALTAGIIYSGRIIKPIHKRLARNFINKTFPIPSS